MSNKCRGAYTITGEGVEAIVNELNKRAEDSYVDITDMLGPKWAGRMMATGAHAGPDGTLVPDYVPETVYFAGRAEDWPLLIKEGRAEFSAETRSVPPVDALTILSDVYQVEITLSYSLQSDNWMNHKTLRFNQGHVTLVRYGYFVLADQGQPIHHWVAECQGKAVNLMKEAGVKVLGGDATGASEGDDQVHVEVKDGDIVRVRHIPGVVSCLPYTLDEDDYILSAQSDLDWGAARDPHGNDIESVERPIELLPEEVSALYGILVDMARRQPQPGQPRTGEASEGTPVTEVELARFGRYYGDICSCDKEFRPTAREIRLLGPLVTVERWAELQQALTKPVWMKQPLQEFQEAQRARMAAWATQ